MKSRIVRFAYCVVLVVLICAMLFGGLQCFASQQPSDSNNKGLFYSSAKGAFVLERTSGRVLYAKNQNERLPMASTTKIATALTVLNNCANIDANVNVAPQAVGVEGSSVYLKQGEEWTIRDLLYGLLLRSGNDCAVQLAISIGGSVEQFVQFMNQTAANLGCVDTNFANPHGLHDDTHYTTAKDLATITCAALDNATFAQIVSSQKYSCSSGNRVFVNKNKTLFSYQFADGVKTGYTKKAGRCFVGSATCNGMSIVTVLLNCGPMFEESVALCQTAFDNYKMNCVVPKNKVCGCVQLNGKRKYLCCESSFYYPTTKDERLSTRIDLLNKELNVFLDGHQIATLPLAAMELPHER